MYHPSDLRWLAARIIALQGTNTHDWHPADELEFKAILPDSRSEVFHFGQRLPEPELLRTCADRLSDNRDPLVDIELNVAMRAWLRLAERAEGLVRDIRLRLSVKRMTRDLRRGRLPGC